MKVTIDASRCEGKMYCVKTAPDVFDTDDFGYSRVSETGELPEGVIASVKAAEKLCPQQAVRLHTSA